MSPDFTALADADLLKEIIRRENLHLQFWNADRNWHQESDARRENDELLGLAQEEAKRRGLLPAPQPEDVAP